MKNNWVRLMAGALASVVLVGAIALTGGMKKGSRTDGLLYQASGIHPDAELLLIDRQTVTAEEYLYWLAYDCDPALIRRNASELWYQYRQTKGRRTVVEGGADTVKELCRRGYTLGIISDLVGRREVDEWLDQDGLRPYFQTVQQSSVTYIRKPGPAIYYYAMEEVGAEPENCCYVGDNLNRDIIGAKAVDFGMTVTVQYQKDKPLKLTAENRPDAKVYRFPDLLDIFPKRGQVAVEKLIPPEDGK